MVSPFPVALILALAWPNLVAGDAKSPRKLKAEAFIVTGHPTPATTYIEEVVEEVLCADGTHGCDTSSTRCIAVATDEVAEGVSIKCQCLVGFITDPTSVNSCLATTHPTSTPTLHPTQLPCADGNHHCDTVVSVCQHDESHQPAQWCECLDGYVMFAGNCVATLAPSFQPTNIPSSLPTIEELPIAVIETTPHPTLAPLTPEEVEEMTPEEVEEYEEEVQEQEEEQAEELELTPEEVMVTTPFPTKLPSVPPSSVPSVSPTPPSASPTLTPTHEACADGFHDCDTETSVCQHEEPTSGDDFFTSDSVFCVCLDGFVKNEDDKCVATPAPTATPTYSPTVNPTVSAVVELSNPLTDDVSVLAMQFTVSVVIPKDGTIKLELPPSFQDVSSAAVSGTSGIDGSFDVKSMFEVNGGVHVAGVGTCGESTQKKIKKAINATYNLPHGSYDITTECREPIDFSALSANATAGASDASDATDDDESASASELLRRRATDASCSPAEHDASYTLLVRNPAFWTEEADSVATKGLLHGSDVFASTLKQEISDCVVATEPNDAIRSLDILMHRQNDGAVVPAGTSLSITLTGVQCPHDAGPTTSFAIVVWDKDGNEIDRVPAPGQDIIPMKQAAVALSVSGTSELSDVNLVQLD
eukprot:g2135.t1